MTRGDFAREAAFLAAHCSDWAGGVLCVPDWWEREISQEVADRFIAHARNRLAYIEAETRESATKPAYPDPVEKAQEEPI